jgi:outer membrane lipoprotein-sorting protein
MKMKTARALLIVCAITLSGCFNRLAIEKPRISGHEVPADQESQIFDRLRAASGDVQSFRAVSETRITYKEESTRLRHAFLFKKPSQLRLETFPTNANYSLNLLIANPGKVTLVEPSEHMATIASSGANLIRKSFYIPADEKDLISFLCGRISEGMLQATLDDEKHRMLVNEESSTITLIKGDFDYYWELDAETLLLKRALLRNRITDRFELAITYEAYADIEGGKVPEIIKLEMPTESLVATFALRSQKMNLELPDSLFQVRIPGTYTVRQAD